MLSVFIHDAHDIHRVKMCERSGLVADCVRPVRSNRGVASAGRLVAAAVGVEFLLASTLLACVQGWYHICLKSAMSSDTLQAEQGVPSPRQQLQQMETVVLTKTTVYQSLQHGKFHLKRQFYPRNVGEGSDGRLNTEPFQTDCEAHSNLRDKVIRLGANECNSRKVTFLRMWWDPFIWMLGKMKWSNAHHEDDPLPLRQGHKHNIPGNGMYSRSPFRRYVWSSG